MRPAFSGLVTVVPIRFEGRTTEKRQNWREEVEGCDKCDRKPHDGLVYLGEIEHQ